MKKRYEVLVMVLDLADSTQLAQSPDQPPHYLLFNSHIPASREELFAAGATTPGLKPIADFLQRVSESL